MTPSSSDQTTAITAAADNEIVPGAASIQVSFVYCTIADTTNCDTTPPPYYVMVTVTGSYTPVVSTLTEIVSISLPSIPLKATSRRQLPL
jgi:hypothetical protein